MTQNGNNTDDPVQIDYPEEVGETKEINGHRVTLHDPPGAIGYKFNCDRCGIWATSAIHFQDECSPESDTDQDKNE